MNNSIKLIIDYILEIAKEKGYWAITTGKVMEITQLEPFQFFSYLESSKKLTNMPEDLNFFNNNNPEDLITLLECIYSEDTKIAKSFSEAGIFISYKDMIEINDFLINSISKIQNKHIIKENDFQAMLRGTESFQEAIKIYLDEEFDIEKIIKNTCLTYMSKKHFTLRDLAKKTITNYMKSLFDRNIMIKENLLYSLVYKLKKYAKKIELFKEKKSYSSSSNQRRAESFKEKKENHKQKNRLSPKDKAKKLLNIKGEISLEILKKKYREMMKIYHPDRNPSGLERSQEINTAYSLLLSEIS